MLVDLHLHTTRYSTGCSVLEPREMMVRLRDLGLDGGAITEHNYLWSQAELERLKEDTGTNGLFLVSGKEIECDIGHLLVFGAAGGVEPMRPALEIVDRVHRNGGVVIWAHPFRYGRYDGVPDERIVEIVRVCDGFEALTPSHSSSENDRALALAEAYGLTATGGSDAHTAGAVGRCLTRFERPLADLADLAAALKDGACTPVMGR